MTMQGKFTNKAQEVLKRAQEAALKLGNKYVGTEHILLGLTLVSDSVAAQGAPLLTIFLRTLHLVQNVWWKAACRKHSAWAPVM